MPLNIFMVAVTCSMRIYMKLTSTFPENSLSCFLRKHKLNFIKWELEIRKWTKLTNHSCDYMIIKWKTTQSVQGYFCVRLDAHKDSVKVLCVPRIWYSRAEGRSKWMTSSDAPSTRPLFWLLVCSRTPSISLSRHNYLFWKVESY